MLIDQLKKYPIIRLIMNITTISIVLQSCDNGGGGGGGGGALQGQWTALSDDKNSLVKDCSSINSNLYYKLSLSVTGNQIVRKYEQFSDSACSSKLTEDIITGTIVNQGSSPLGTTISTLDMTFDNETLKPVTDAAVENLNLTQFCDVTNWVKNTATPIIGKSCATIPLANRPVFTIYKIDSKGNLQLGASDGETKNGLSESARHTQIELRKYNR